MQRGFPLGIMLLTATTLLTASQGGPAVTRREPVFENAHVRVWKSFIEPGTPLSFHRHERGRTLVAIRGGTVRIQQRTGESRVVTWESGQAYWLDADPPGTEHIDVNESGRTIEVIVSEQRDASAGPGPR